MTRETHRMLAIISLSMCILIAFIFIDRLKQRGIAANVIPADSSATSSMSISKDRVPVPSRRSHLSGHQEGWKGASTTERRYLASAGTLSSNLMTDFDIRAEQFQVLQQVVSRYWAKMSSIAAENVTLDEEASENSPNGADIFKIPAMKKTDREAMFENLSHELEGIASKKVSNAIIHALRSTEKFGAMGKYDVILEFGPLTRNETDINGNRMPPTISQFDYNITYRYMEPSTGRVVYEDSADLQEIRDDFGNIFSIR